MSVLKNSNKTKMQHVKLLNYINTRESSQAIKTASQIRQKVQVAVGTGTFSWLITLTIKIKGSSFDKQEIY